MKQKKPTVTIAVSAYNEEKNILPFLKSILFQKEHGFSIEKILIISDGSTDKTVKRAREIKSPKIIIEEYKERTGKSARLNGIYSSLTSDFLVQSDADVIFSNPNVIKEIIQPLIKNKKVGMCGGNPKPLKAETFTEKAINCTCEIYIKFRKEVRGGNNAFSVDGRILAYRKELVKKINVPIDMIANDHYTYYCCLTKGYQYIFVESAVVSFRSPQNFKDHIKQNTRFLAAPIRMTQYFPKELIKKETSIPKDLLIWEALIQFLKNPILCTYIFTINRYCHIKARGAEKKLTAKWDIARTTKALFN